VPEVVGQAVSQALALVPADRFASAADFARALDLSRNSTSVSGIASVQEPVAEKGEKSKTSATNRAHARRPLFATLVLGVAIGLGLLFGWSRYRALPSARIGDAPTGSEIRLAVLPFDNLGDTANAYFADGIADQLRGKLTQLSGLTVIARTSSVGYRGTHTTPQQIAHELGVRYLLTGTVSWAKGPNGESRVQVNPELVEVTDSSAPASKWQQPFDASLTDVFKVQADIATQVANALGVALAIGAQKELAERPTKNLAAYDAFLRGESLSNQVASSDPASLRQSLKYYQQATALDPSFANAWTRIATVASLLYANSVPTRAAADLARDAAARVRELAPNSALAHVAVGFYEGFVRQNADDALAEYEAALRIDPTDPTLMNRTASAQLAQGHWDSALSLVRRAQNLDPRSVSITSRLATSSLWLRHYAEAQQAGDRAMALAPTSLTAMQNRVMVALSGGDLSGARAIIAASPAGLDQDVLVSYVAEYWDLYWVLTDAQQRRLLGLSPATFDNDRGSWGLCLAEVYRMRGDNARSLVYADSARIALEQQLKETPNDAQIHVLLAVALAYLGHSAEAIKEGERATALDPVSSNAITGPYYMHQLMRVYILGGQKEKALDLLEQLLKMPYYLSPAWIRIDPTFAPLKGDPTFERLANGSA
jgi:serine/threonine-protein kinase